MTEAILNLIWETTDPAAFEGLSPQAYATLDAALTRTAWADGHRRRFALVEGDEVLASAMRYDLTATLDGRRMPVCAIGEVFAGQGPSDHAHARVLVERLLAEARKEDIEMALLFATGDPARSIQAGFQALPTLDVELRVEESPRHGAPMTMVRGGEDRDLSAVADMHRVRAAPFRFSIDRDVDHVKYVITRKRLLAGLSPPGTRQLHFAIAEEGITAAAYVLISAVEGTWTIEECGDRDPSGARVGALLQALIAREPGERRPIIRGWLPPGFVPPQVTIVSAKPSTEIVLAGLLSRPDIPFRLTAGEALLWRSDRL